MRARTDPATGARGRSSRATARPAGGPRSRASWRPPGADASLMPPETEKSAARADPVQPAREGDAQWPSPRQALSTTTPIGTDHMPPCSASSATAQPRASSRPLCRSPRGDALEDGWPPPSRGCPTMRCVRRPRPTASGAFGLVLVGLGFTLRRSAPASGVPGVTRNPHRCGVRGCLRGHTSRCPRPARGEPSSSAPVRRHAVAVLLERGGFRTTLRARTPEQAARLEADRETRVSAGRRAAARAAHRALSGGIARADHVFLGVPSRGLGEVIAGLRERGLAPHAGHLAGEGARAAARDRADGAADPDPRGARVACVGGPANAREMVTEAPAVVAGSVDAPGADDRRRVRPRRRVRREVERPDRRRVRGRGQECRGPGRLRDRGAGPQRGGRRRRPHLPRGLALRRGAGARPSHDRAGRHRRPRRHRPRPQDPHRHAGELLAEGVPAAEIPGRIGQAVESLDLVPCSRGRSHALRSTPRCRTRSAA